MLYELLKVDAKVKSKNSCAHLARYLSLYLLTNIKSTFIHVCSLNEPNMLQLRLWFWLWLFACCQTLEIVFTCFCIFSIFCYTRVSFPCLYVYLLLIESCCASCHHCYCYCCCFRFRFFFSNSILFCCV